MAALKKTLEPSMRLKICYTEKDRSIADQCTEIVKMLLQEKQQQEDRQEYEKSSPSIEKSIIPDRESIIIASGGDGTVSAIAGATLNSGIPVGIIPRGTANAFSVALGIPTDSVEEACHNILRGNVRDVDGALLSAELLWHTSLFDEDDLKIELKDYDVDDSQSNLHLHKPRTSRWINHAGLGFEAGLVDNATRQLKDKFGNLAYTIGAAQQVLQNEQFRCTFIVDDDESTEKTVETNIITIANVDASTSIFAQGFGKVIPDDGFFEVTIGTATGLDEIRQLATLVANALVKNNLGSDTILSFRCKKIKVTCDPPQKLLVDGEVIRDMDTITFTCVPKGLKIFAPSPPENA
jgi:diacylglycerol kinase family enzyme